MTGAKHLACGTTVEAQRAGESVGDVKTTAPWCPTCRRVVKVDELDTRGLYALVRDQVSTPIHPAEPVIDGRRDRRK